MSLWLALRFPFFQCHAAGICVDNDHSLVVSTKNKVCAATRPCLQAGVELGMPVSTAKMLLDCTVLPRNHAQEARFFNGISDQLYRYTPYIQHYCPNEANDHGDQGLLLELSRCLTLFGGVEPLIDRIFSCLPSTVSYQWALNFSAKAAWLLSLYPNRHKPDLLSLKTKELDAFPKEADALHSMGFIFLSDVKKHLEKEGSFSLQKRFQPGFLQYLSDVLSSKEAPASLQSDLFSSSASTPLEIHIPKENYSDFICFDFPVGVIEHLQNPMKVLLGRLGDHLIQRQKQCSGFSWRFRDIYDHQETICIRSEAVYRDWSFLYELSVIKLEQLGLPFEVDQLELIAPVLVDVQLETGSILPDASKRNRAEHTSLQRALAKIQARLGENSVFKVSYQNDHLPELAQCAVMPDQKAEQGLSEVHEHVIRPSWLLNTPIAIGKHQNHLRWQGKVELIRGPERLEGHWWDEPSARDYFIAVREDQVRLWVFNDLFKNEWFVQGVF